MEHGSDFKRLTEKLIIARQESVQKQPYSIIHRIELADAYKKLGYPDLAAGDAYKALLLIDELIEDGEYHDEVAEAVNHDFLYAKVANTVIDDGTQDLLRNEVDLAVWAQIHCARAAYEILVESLLACGSLRSAFDYIARARKAFPNEPTFRNQEVILTQKLQSHFMDRGDDVDTVPVDMYPEKGPVRRELYPWNKFEPNRTSPDCLEFLNHELSILAPKLEVRVSELPLLTSDPAKDNTNSTVKYVKQLGVFAKEDILPGEQILQEKSLLTGISRLHDSYCDACSVSLGSTSAENEAEAVVSCENCDEVFFCSTECHDLAQRSYHTAICGVDVDQGKVPATEAADTLYTLLLLRALALAETQGLHPLELKEVRYIWGDYHGHDLGEAWQTQPIDHVKFPFGSVLPTLPFSFKSNVLTPLHILEKMDVNIFTSNFYDTWVINTLYAKFRGTASAQQGLDGRPEIGAVHPLWCLANHSCDPNVAWEWQGSMRFWAREHLVDWEGRDPTKQPGIKKDEEIFSHYCDIRLPVQERREWAAGALGGECVCQRCMSEEAKKSCTSHE